MYRLFIEKNISSEDFLKKILKKVLKKYHIEYDIFYNENRKPYIKNNPIFFNISHSGEYIVCVVSDKEIGVDIQKITIKDKVVDRICTTNELKYPITPEYFTILWVKKESYVKKLGIGLSYGLQNVDTTTIDTYDLYRIDDYFIAVCY